MFELPIEIVGLITIGVGFLVTQGVKGALALFGIDLSGKAAALTAVLVGVVVLFVQGIVGMFPPETQEMVATVLGALTLILGMFGAHKTMKSLAGK